MTDVLTAEEVLRREEELERQAGEAYQFKTDECSFRRGYINQQVYACLTCSPPQAGRPSGICYSCAVECHTEHDVIELFVKRNFKCDCGTARCPGASGCLLDLKPRGSVNERNAYGHNFFGRYCSCDEVYDPEAETSSMIQCVACQDWFHERCLDPAPPAMDSFADFVCAGCTSRLGLGALAVLSTLALELPAAPASVCISSTPPDPDQASTALFLIEDWREHVCRCPNCAARASGPSSDCPWLHAAEPIWTPERDPDADRPLLQAGVEMVASGKVDRDAAVAGAAAIDALGTKLKDFLRTFAESGRVVTDADISSFFSQLKRERARQ